VLLAVVGVTVLDPMFTLVVLRLPRPVPVMVMIWPEWPEAGDSELMTGAMRCSPCPSSLAESFFSC
jgi:hypothetical protein